MNQQKDPPLETADGCTWNTYDGVNSWIKPGGDYNPTALLDDIFISDEYDRGWKTWNVTAAVQSWVNDNQSNYGFLLATLEHANYRQASFYSKDYPEPQFWPRLEIAYEELQEPLIKDLSVSPGILDPYQQNSEVKISYRLEEASLVQVQVYDSQGIKVKALYEDFDDNGAELEKPEKQEAGLHDARWCGVIDFKEMAALAGDKGVLIAPDGAYNIKLVAASVASGTVESAEAAVVIKSE